MSGNIRANDSFVLLEQLDLLDKAKEGVLATCLLEFEPYKKELQKQIDILKDVREPLKTFTPYGKKKETHEVYRFLCDCISSVIISICGFKKVLGFNVAKIIVPLIISSTTSIEEQLEISKEYKKDLLSVVDKLSIASELLQTQICKEDREENIKVFMIVHKELKFVVNNLRWLAEEIDNSMVATVNSYISFKVI